MISRHHKNNGPLCCKKCCNPNREDPSYSSILNCSLKIIITSMTCTDFLQLCTDQIVAICFELSAAPEEYCISFQTSFATVLASSGDDDASRSLVRTSPAPPPPRSFRGAHGVHIQALQPSPLQTHASGASRAPALFSAASPQPTPTPKPNKLP